MLSMRDDPILIFSISVSVFGLVTILMLALNPPMMNDGFFWRKPLIGIAFSLICVLGIFAAIFPKPCSEAFHFRKENINLNSQKIQATSHHPQCREFSAHVIQIRDHQLCAACTGLLLGAIVALFGTALYFFCGWHIGEASFPIVSIGIIMTILGFFQLKFRSLSRLIFNVVFVLGAFLILVGIDELTKSLLIDLFLVAFIVFWILTRIQLSQWDHQKTCSNCKSHCEAWMTTKK